MAYDFDPGVSKEMWLDHIGLDFCKDCIHSYRKNEGGYYCSKEEEEVPADGHRDCFEEEIR
ncbi:hypothetical protein AKJ51_00305 [candidate division MSBL1 archaeon SCGC-AAA382A20]|uniref:Uncharacterized protein n=1 Tax=candidate division MSBL1 archaeon SCGC-AAA382A20 TaxID=1698280 RepID=A0A133VMM9_9EURY|nr:hypothetical protein AKJ51_00305 [candidate division MSBL1 archaeon SCGC-AAA382A20]